MDNVPTNTFRNLLSVDVSKLVEQKGGFSYLSWAHAVAQLRLADPTASWEVKRFDGLPYLAAAVGYFVEVEVTVGGLKLSQIHPVLDGRNRPIQQPTAFDVNSSIQRCLVKAIALHGLGLSVYAGEDLTGITDAEERPTEPTEPPPSPPVRPLRPVPAQPTRPTSSSGEFATVNQLRYMERLIDEAGVDVHDLLSYFGYESLDRVPKGDVDRVLRAIQSKRRAA